MNDYFNGGMWSRIKESVYSLNYKFAGISNVGGKKCLFKLHSCHLVNEND